MAEVKQGADSEVGSLCGKLCTGAAGGTMTDAMEEEKEEEVEEEAGPGISPATRTEGAGTGVEAMEAPASDTGAAGPARAADSAEHFGCAAGLEVAVTSDTPMKAEEAAPRSGLEAAAVAAEAGKLLSGWTQQQEKTSVKGGG